MMINFKFGTLKSNQKSWREYQRSLKKPAKQKRALLNLIKVSLILIFFIGFLSYSPGRIGCASHYSFNSLDNKNQAAITTTPLSQKPVETKKDEVTKINNDKPLAPVVLSSNEKSIQKSDNVFSKHELQSVLDGKLFLNYKEKNLSCNIKDRKYQVETTMDCSLQRFIESKFALKTSRFIGVVVMDPSTGRVLSMVGYDKNNESTNPCTDNRFPAASVFKFITASAAIEKCGYNEDQVMTFTGNKYTLYKAQIKDTVASKRANKISFRNSFALSVNPVFGNIGVYGVGKEVLNQYAQAFCFNRKIDFEIPFAPSVVSFPDEPYQLAGISSGFNRTTTISPLYGALLVSSVFNEGKIVEPTIVDRITDEKGEILYNSKPSFINQAIKSETTKVLKNLMEGTIISGTCRKYFRGFQKDQVLSKLTMGGKTGSINGDDKNIRYDWFVGFAQKKDGDEKLVVSIVVAHEKFIGIKSSQYARLIFREYFGSRTNT